MKEQAAYSLLHLSGKTDITQSDVESFMNKCGVSFDKEVLKIFFAQLEGKSVKEVCQAGAKKHVTMPAGGGAGPAKASGATAAAAEAPKEEAKEEEEDVDMGGLFGGDDDEY